MNFLESLLHLDLPRPFVEACSSGYTAIFESKETKMEKAIKTACKNAGVTDEGELSDGNHTFNSLYHQRCTLFATLVNLFPSISWKTKKHDDGKPCHDGKNFLVCIETPKGPYSYHYPLKDWDMFKCKEIDKARKFDGHTDKDVERLLSLLPEQLPKSVLGDIWNRRDSSVSKSNYQKPAPLVESVKYIKGHKNSKGEDAPWTIVSHETGKILSSHKSKKAAEEHLRQMEYYKHKD